MKTPLNITVEHEKIIKNAIVMHPYNLQLAFRIASEQIQVFSPLQVQRYWYRYLRYDEVLVTLQTSKFRGYNTKNFVVQTKKVKLSNNKKVGIQCIIPFNLK